MLINVMPVGMNWNYSSLEWLEPREKNRELRFQLELKALGFTGVRTPDLRHPKRELNH